MESNEENPICQCMRPLSTCDEDWHRQPDDALEAPVTLTVRRSVLERAAYLVMLNDGAWSTQYKLLAPWLLNPKPDPSTPIKLPPEEPEVLDGPEPCYKSCPSICWGCPRQ